MDPVWPTAQMRLPSISILVATWNCREQLAAFLASLAAQSWQHWQLLILDNQSSDGSAQCVAEFRQGLLRPEKLIWSSQPDMGIYDAWNRGLTMAEGDYICFIGADDVFVDPDSLARIAMLTLTGADLITARNAYHAPTGRFLRNWGHGWQWTRMRQSMNIAHPGMLVRRDLFARYGGFDPSYRICGDYEWFLRLPSGLRSIHSSDVVLRVVQAGVSHTKIGAVYRETFQAQRRHLGPIVSLFCWGLNWAKYGRRRLVGLA